MKSLRLAHGAVALLGSMALAFASADTLPLPPNLIGLGKNAATCEQLRELVEHALFLQNCPRQDLFVEVFQNIALGERLERCDLRRSGCRHIERLQHHDEGGYAAVGLLLSGYELQAQLSHLGPRIDRIVETVRRRLDLPGPRVARTSPKAADLEKV
jgi:hypothetical protein